jgi:hypothetical protein
MPATWPKLHAKARNRSVTAGERRSKNRAYPAAVFSNVGLSAEAVVKPDGRNKAVPQYVDRNARDTVLKIGTFFGLCSAPVLITMSRRQLVSRNASLQLHEPPRRGSVSARLPQRKHLPARGRCSVARRLATREEIIRNKQRLAERASIEPERLGVSFFAQCDRSLTIFYVKSCVKFNHKLNTKVADFSADRRKL